MEQLDLLLDAGLYYDAFDWINQFGDPNSAEYLFYLGFIQAQLGWTEEAIQTLTKYKTRAETVGLLGTASGLLADIYHNEGRLFDSVLEISVALRVEPDCPLIQKKAEEIGNDLNSFYSAIITLLICNKNKGYAIFRLSPTQASRNSFD